MIKTTLANIELFNFRDILEKPNFFCNMVKTRNILGYDMKTNQKIYKNECNGFCIEQINKPHECFQIKKNIKVYKNEKLTDSIITSQVYGCECKPKRCTVDVLGFTKYIDHDSYYYDECNRKCRCSYGELVDCCRQRKSFTSMSYLERERYINTVKTVSTDLLYKTQYDNLINQHQTLFSSGIHSNSIFLPWHRYYILELENLLQLVDCRVTVPYWDWVTDSTSPMIGSPWINSLTWLGSNGDSSQGNCVVDGPFAYPGWTLPNGQCLRRVFNTGASLATLADVQSLYNTYPNPTASDYNGIRFGLETGPGMHNTGHCVVSGTMCSSGAASAPEFFMHHANIDKLWADWQKLSPAHVTAYDGSLFSSMPGTSYTPNDLMDLNNQPNNIKVCYVEPRKWSWIVDLIKVLPNNVLNTLPKVQVTPNNVQWLKRLGVDINHVQKLEENRNKNALTREEAIKTNPIVATIGFDLEESIEKQLDNIAVISNIEKELSPNINDRCDDKTISVDNILIRDIPNLIKITPTNKPTKRRKKNKKRNRRTRSPTSPPSFFISNFDIFNRG